MIVAVGKDIAELAQLLKIERKALRKTKKRAHSDSLAITTARATQSEEDNVRFADLFRPWKELAPPTEADRKLFLTAVSDAKPLTTSTRAARVHEPPPAFPRHSKADEAAALEASQLAMYPSPMSWDIGADIEDEQSYLRAGVSPDLLRKLRRGQWTIQAELDLHHHTQDEAHAAMAEFVRNARDQDWRCVRIIHGKGLSSHMKIPVLRSKVRRWLQQKDEVLAYCEPRPNGGGSGAVLVLLRGAR
jgi:DNA-nicking Smr family endonuclease